MTSNLDILRQIRWDPKVRHACGGASMIVADGFPLILASRLKGDPLPERVAGSNLIRSLSEGAAREGKSVFLLGGAPGAAEAAARVLVERTPALRIAGTHCPPLGFERDEREVSVIIDRLRSASPDIVYVALGSPKTEFLIDRLRHQVPGVWWMGVGISFSFLAGQVRRAPRWMQRGGLEWVHRLSQEPRRLMRRYLLQGIPFALALLSWALYRRFRPGLRGE